MTANLNSIETKLSNNEPLDASDGLKIAQSADIFTWGRLADRQCLEQIGSNVYFSINKHINYTNICSVGCAFCSFYRQPAHQDAYHLPVEQVVQQALEAYQNHATEVHIVGGINPELPYTYYRDLIRTVRLLCPDIHIKAFTAVEIINIAAKASQFVEFVLADLQQSGLNALTGGGAEILNETYFRNACPDKSQPSAWIDVHRTAHRLGLMSNATMLYGFGESLTDRVQHLITLRNLQQESLDAGHGHFQCFVPLPYLPANTPDNPNPAIDALTDLRMIALSRLLLDNFKYVKAFWPMLGIKLTQIAICFGANDIDGTVQQYQIVDKQQDNATLSLTPADIQSFISETGKHPIQRNGYYQPITPTN